MMIPILLLASLFSVSPDWTDRYERVLVPLFVEGELPGAQGSRWVTELTARNDGDAFVHVTQTVWCPPRRAGDGRGADVRREERAHAARELESAHPGVRERDDDDRALTGAKC